MKIGEIIQRVQSLYSSGVESYDTRITPKHIWSKIVSARASYISKIYNGDTSIFNQDICVSLDVVNRCCNLPKDIKVVSGKVPSFISIEGAYMLSGRRLVNVPKHQIVYLDTSITNAPMYYMDNNHIILLDRQTLRYINVRGVLYDPLEYYNVCNETYGLCKKYCNKCVSAYDVDLVVTDDMVEYIVRYSVDELIRLFSMTKEDKSTDASDETISMIPNTKQQQQ